MPRPAPVSPRTALLLALCVASLLAPLPTRADPLLLPREREGSWLASDKTLHFAGSAALALSAQVEGRRECAALGFAVGIGVAKELYDATLKPRRAGRGASRKDLVVDLLGAAAGIALFRALDR
jgi:uncharacterized protein YfiM (DUF2279 family)